MQHEQIRIKKGTQSTPQHVKSGSAALNTNTHQSSLVQHYRNIGNQAVQQLIESYTLQPKLKIGQPNDKYEQEADRVADQVMRMVEPVGSLTNDHSSLVQRKSTCHECEEEEEEIAIQTKPIAEQITPLIQRQEEKEIEEEEKQVQVNQSNNKNHKQDQFLQLQAQNNLRLSGIPSIVHEVLDSPGQTLDNSTRNLMESRLGHDFRKVRVHHDDKAAEASRAVDAEAYTTGTHIVFNENCYAPNTNAGKKLLAHELTHVVQQRHGAVSRAPDFQSALEHEASQAANSVAAGNKVAKIDGVSAPGIDRSKSTKYQVALRANRAFSEKNFREKHGLPPKWPYRQDLIDLWNKLDPWNIKDYDPEDAKKIKPFYDEIVKLQQSEIPPKDGRIDGVLDKEVADWLYAKYETQKPPVPTTTSKEQESPLAAADPTTAEILRLRPLKMSHLLSELNQCSEKKLRKLRKHKNQNTDRLRLAIEVILYSKYESSGVLEFLRDIPGRMEKVIPYTDQQSAIILFLCKHTVFNDPAARTPEQHQAVVEHISSLYSPRNLFGSRLPGAVAAVIPEIMRPAAFFYGLSIGLRVGLGKVDYEALFIKLLLHGAFTPYLIRGAFERILEEFKELYELIKNLDEFARELAQLLTELFVGPEGRKIALQLGIETGKNAAQRIVDLARKEIGPPFARELGKIVGPLIFEIILAILTEGVYTAFSAVVRLMKRAGTFSRILKRLGKILSVSKRKPHKRRRSHGQRKRKEGPEQPPPRRTVPDSLKIACRIGSVNCDLDKVRHLPIFREHFRLRDPYLNYLGDFPSDVKLILSPSLRRDIPIPGGDDAYIRFLKEVEESDWTQAFTNAMMEARRPGAVKDVNFRELSIGGRRERWPLDNLSDPWQIHHEPPLHFGGHDLPMHWRPVPYRIHNLVGNWWDELKKLFLREHPRNEWRNLVSDEELHYLGMFLGED